MAVEIRQAPAASVDRVEANESAPYGRGSIEFTSSIGRLITAGTFDAYYKRLLDRSGDNIAVLKVHEPSISFAAPKTLRRFVERMEARIGLDEPTEEHDKIAKRVAEGLQASEHIDPDEARRRPSLKVYFKEPRYGRKNDAFTLAVRVGDVQSPAYAGENFLIQGEKSATKKAFGAPSSITEPNPEWETPRHTVVLARVRAATFEEVLKFSLELMEDVDEEIVAEPFGAIQTAGKHPASTPS